MSISEELKKEDLSYKEMMERLEKAREACARKRAEERQANLKSQQERKIEKERTDEKDAMLEIIYDETEGLDEPKVYIVRYEYLVNRVKGKDTCCTDSKRIVMTEREKKVMEMCGDISKILPVDRDKIRSLQISEGTISLEEEKITAESIRRKVKIIKSSPESEKNKTAQIKYKGYEFEIDDEHAALCSMNVNKDRFMLSAELERQANEKLKEEHPVKYTFKMIKDAIKNRSRGRE